MEMNRQMMAVLLIAIVALGGNFLVLFTENSQISHDNSNLSTQIMALQGSLASLVDTTNNLQSQLNHEQGIQSTQSQQITVLKGNLTDIQLRLTNIIGEFNSSRLSDLSFQSYIYSQLQTINITLQSLTNKLGVLTPQIPLSTLVIIGDNYSSASSAFTFYVRNTLDENVYAQISALLYGTTTLENCGGVAGTYVSQIYAFKPLSVTVYQLSLASGLYNGCAVNPVTSLTLYLAASQSVAVSPTYQFNIVPGYNNP